MQDVKWMEKMILHVWALDGLMVKRVFSSYLLSTFVCNLLALLHLHKPHWNCTHTLRVSQTYVKTLLNDYWNMLQWKLVHKNKRSHKKYAASFSRHRFTLISGKKSSRSHLTHFQITLLLCFILFILTRSFPSSLCHPMIAFVLQHHTFGQDGDWIENWVFSFRIFLGILKQKWTIDG